MNGSNCTALLVVGHGTRSPQGLNEYRQLLAHITQKLPHTVVEGGFLEMAEPTIDTAMQRLADRGAHRVVVLPLLLFEAGHAKRDIPRATRRAAQRYGLHASFASPLGIHPRMVELSAQRFHDTIRQNASDTQGSIDPGDVLWVLVGRGSRDAAATAQFHEFLAERQRITAAGAARAAFLAMATPRIEAVVEEIKDSPLSWVVIQPHLLFAGELLERLQRIVHTQDALSARQQWFMTEHLGCSAWVAEAVVDRFHQALAIGEKQLSPGDGACVNDV